MNFEEEIHAVFTCGLCETICDCDDYQSHKCLEGYDDVHIDENYYFYPLLADKMTIVRRALLKDGTEGIIEDRIYGEENYRKKNPNICHSPKPTKRKVAEHRRTSQVSKRGKLDDDEIEILLMEVERRIPLWNFDIPIEKRSRETVAELWQEVSDALNGRLSADEAKKKFKSLRDTHRKIIRAEYRTSGSARIETKEQWKFYRCCEFLRDSCLVKPTSSNVARPSDGQDSDNDQDLSVETNIMDESMNEIRSEISDGNLAIHNSDPSTTRDKKNRKRTRDTQESQSIEALNRIADVMCRETPPLVLPEKPVMDAIDHFLIGAGHELRKLPETKQFDACMEVLNLIHRIRRQYTTNNK